LPHYRTPGGGNILVKRSEFDACTGTFRTSAPSRVDDDVADPIQTAALRFDARTMTLREDAGLVANENDLQKIAASAATRYRR
jgi:hypothetical protein